MSSTKRGGKRSPADVYDTPIWCPHRLLEAVDLPSGTWCDPCAGTGNIILSTRMIRPEVRWKAYEIRPECLEPLNNLDTDPVIVDFLSPNCQLPRFEVILMNPPYRLAQEFIERGLRCADHVVALLRLNYLGSRDRNDFMRNDCPDVYVLPNRPAFMPGGRTDSIEYAWMHWRKNSAPKRSGRIMVLPNTPLAERSL